jgi:hypothetical protein
MKGNVVQTIMMDKESLLYDNLINQDKKLQLRIKARIVSH